MRTRAGQQVHKDRLIFRAALALAQFIDLYSKFILAAVFACAISILALDAVASAHVYQCGLAALGSQGLHLVAWAALAAVLLSLVNLAINWVSETLTRVALLATLVILTVVAAFLA